MTLKEDGFSFGRLKLRGRLFRLWIVLSVAAALVWLALSGPQVLALIKASEITCFPVTSGKLPRARAFEEHRSIEKPIPPAADEPNGGTGTCDSKTFRFADLSQPQKEVAIRINHINVFDARLQKFKLFEADQLDAEQRNQLGWYFQDKAAQRRRQVNFLLIYILGPIFAIPIILLFVLRAYRWVNKGL